MVVREKEAMTVICDFFKSLAYYMECSGKLWWLQCNYLYKKEKKKRNCYYMTLL